MLAKKSFVFLIILFIFFALIFLPSQTNAAIIGKTNYLPQSGGLSSGLVGYWTFDGRDITNGRINDVSGNGNHGNLISLATTSFYSAGKIGQGAFIDGPSYNSARYISINNSVPLQLGGGLATFSFWIKPVIVGTSGFYTSIIAKRDNNSTGNYEIYMTPASSGGKIGFYNGSTFDSTIIPSKGVWTHIAVTVGGGNCLFYKNGILISTLNSCNMGAAATAPTQIGYFLGVLSSDEQQYDGSIDDLRIYSRVLSASEIKKLYSIGDTKQGISAPVNASKPGCTGINCGLVAYWTFDGRDIPNGRINDLSGNGNHGNASGISTTTFYKQGQVGQSGNFDSTDDYVNLGSNTLLTSGSPFTLSWWEKANADTVQYPSRFNLDLAGSTNYFLVLRGGSNATTYGPLSWGRSPQSNLSIRSATAPTVAQSVGKWKHWVITGTDPNSTTPSDYNLYVDGVLQTVSQGPTFGSVSNNRIGYDGTDGAADANIDDVRIYNRAITASEVKQLYNIGSTKLGVSAPVNASKPGCTGINCGLVAYWTFDGRDIPNGRINDLSGNGNHGNASGISTTTFYKQGKVGQAASFDGVNDYVSLGSLSTGSNILSFSYWAKRSAGSSNVIEFELASNFNSFAPTFLINPDGSTGRFNMAIHTDASNYRSEYATLPSDNVWHHYVVVLDNSTASANVDVYIDGVLQNTTTTSTTSGGGSTFKTDALYIASRGGSSLFEKTTLDDVRIYNRAITASEALQLYNSGR